MNKPEEAMHPSIDIKIQEFTPGGGNSRRRLSKGRSRRNKDAINQYSGTNGGASAGTGSPPADVPMHSGRYYSGSYRGLRSESDNLVVSLKDRIKLLQQRLVEVMVFFFLLNVMYQYSRIRILYQNINVCSYHKIWNNLLMCLKGFSGHLDPEKAR
jgi:hypothetical protein